LLSIIKAVVLRTADTNTRVRKKSVEIINQLWNNEDSLKSAVIRGNEDQAISMMIASVLTDGSLQEKAIVGRLGLFIKRAMSLESGEELNKMSHHLIFGKIYEQLTEFACSWCLHKNTKVRQCALKLIVEICRVNHIDPRGQPFKQRIINFILALRPSLRDPLVTKINEVCALESQASLSNMEAPKKK
jgi:predicted ribonuclease YlaK